MLQIPEFSGRDRWPYLPDLLRRHPAVVVRGLVPPAVAARSVAALQAHRERWDPGPVPDEHNFGTVFYAHAMNGNIPDYFARSERVNETMAREFAELWALVHDACSALLGGEPITYRPGWTGPSFVVLGPQSIAAREGGTIHVDWEGLADWGHPQTADLLSQRDTVAYSFVLMLQPTEAGGELRVWNEAYDPDRRSAFIPDPEIAPDAESCLLTYGVGDLVVVNSLAVHQIQPYRGDARITLNFHLLARDGGWHLWF